LHCSCWFLLLLAVKTTTTAQALKRKTAVAPRPACKQENYLPLLTGMYYNGYILQLAQGCTMQQSSEQEYLQKEICLIVRQISSDESFCKAHELVNKFSITNNPRRILKESKYARLRSFRFLLCKN
jgi:hypothetical protein